MDEQLELFFDPRGVAIIGASTNPGKLSHGVVRNLKNHGYRGPIYPINPKGGDILGLKAYPSIREVPDPVELAVIMIPAPYVAQALDECGQRGLKAVIVITGGFREAGAEGAAAEKQLKEIADGYGMRLIGPNCVGVMDAHLPLDTTFITDMPRPGHIAFVSHSGAICGGTTDWARQTGVGFSRIASLGNQLDVDIADGIAMMQQDPNTRVISIYAEGLPNGRRFVEAASAVFREKPIVMLKAGLTSAGTRAVASHTGALAGSEQAYLAACDRAGALVVGSLQEQNDVANVLATQPLPRGNRVAMLTNAGGPAALAADELDRQGLAMADLLPQTIEQLRGITPRDAQLENPVDMLGGPAAEMYLDAGKVLLVDPNVDMLMAIFVPQAITPVVDVARNVVALAREADKPVICCLVGGESIPDAVRLLNENGVPCYQDPNHAARALGGLVRYRRIRNRPPFVATPLADVNTGAARQVLTAAWQRNGAGVLDAEAAAAVAAAYGIRVPRAGLASTSEEAVVLAESLGYPLALKLVAPGVVHKADVGGVVLNASGPDAVRKTFEAMLRGLSGAQMMVQQMAPQGLEVILGTQRDPQFGQLLMFGLGGTLVEVLKDVAFRLAPISRPDAEAMIAETAAGRIMKGVRGQPAADLAAVTEALQRIGQLAHDFPGIAEMDINPLIVGTAGQGAWAVDVRIALDQDPQKEAA
ncbi:MAG: acetate--CoA ligase family protein [Anaerolineae bacterium]|nr:acetate--CoA ligase family protein [Anaerolineae bacterium]